MALIPFRTQAKMALGFCTLVLMGSAIARLQGAVGVDPLALGQLLAFAAIGFVALLAIAHGPCRVRARVYGTAMALIAAGGAVLALCELVLAAPPSSSPAIAGGWLPAGSLVSFVLLCIGSATSGWRRREH